jgi:hypothetical protein
MESAALEGPWPEVEVVIAWIAGERSDLAVTGPHRDPGVDQEEVGVTPR